jgi:transcriptional regulator with XRE-family HTH domain
MMGLQVGTRLRDARLARKYTQSQLARPDFSVSYISAIERGQIQPSLRALEILAGKLEIHATDLLPELPASVTELSLTEKRTLEEEQCEIVLLEAHIALHQGYPGQAIALLGDLARRSAEVCRESIYYTLLGQAYLEHGFVQESEQLLARTVHALSDPLYPRLLEIQITAYTAMHNTEQAIQLQRASIAYLESQSGLSVNPVLHARLYCSLAQHHSHLGQVDQAAEMLKLAVRALEVCRTYQGRLSVYQRLAEVLQEQGQNRLAALYQQHYIQLGVQARLPGMRSNVQHALGRILLRCRSDEVYASLQTRSQEAMAGRDPLTQASAHVHLATWFLAREEYARAEQHALEARKLAGSSGETLIAADAQFLCGDLSYRRQDYVAADQYIEAGLAMLERLGEGEELVERLAQYARCLEERGLAGRAIVYWRRAYENREKGWPPSL